MVRDLRTALNDVSTVDAWYARDLMTTYDSTSTDMRCPVFRWNYTDKLVAAYPTRFQIHNDQFGLFSLREVITLEIISNAEKVNAQAWGQNYKATGWHYRHDIIGLEIWSNVAKSLPSFTLLDHTNPTDEATIKQYSVKIQPTYGTVYIAMGSRMSKIFGYTPVGKTPAITDGTTGTIKRKSLNVMYSCVRQSFISPCQLTAAGTVHAPIAPRPYTHDSPVPAPSSISRTCLWSLPIILHYDITSLNYYYLPKQPIPVYSDAILDTINGDDIFVYTNVLPNITHIGNHLSPLLVQIPCPAHMFGEDRFSTPYLDLADKTRIISTKTWNIENPLFSTLSPGVNLDDMLVSVSNSYGDRLHLGVLDIQLIIREKTTDESQV